MSPENAKQMIDSLYTRLKNGEDFAVLAATFSNDPGSARDSGSLGWVNPGVMVPEFEERMKKTPVGQISEPFQSQFGWHIIQVDDARPVTFPAMAEVKPQLEEMMRQRKLAEYQQKILKEANIK